MFFSAPFPREKAGEAQKLNSEKCVFYSERKKISTSLFLVLIPKVFPYKRRSLGHNLHQEFLNMPLTLCLEQQQKKVFYTSDTQIFSPFVTILKRPQTSFSSKRFLPIFPRLAQLPLNGFHSLTEIQQKWNFLQNFIHFVQRYLKINEDRKKDQRFGFTRSKSSNNTRRRGQ